MCYEAGVFSIRERERRRDGGMRGYIRVNVEERCNKKEEDEDEEIEEIRKGDVTKER